MTQAFMRELEDAIRAVGDFGKVTLVIERGRVAFVEQAKSIAVRDPRQEELRLG